MDEHFRTIVEGLRGDDDASAERALAELVQWLAPRIRQWLQRAQNQMYLQAADREEVLQETVIEVWNRRHEIDATKSFSAYVAKIVYHKACDLLGKNKVGRETRLLHTLHISRLTPRQARLMQKVSAALTSLKKDRKVTDEDIEILRAWAHTIGGQWATPELASEIGMKQATMRVRLSRLLIMIKGACGVEVEGTGS